jgi:hypothetical protein
MIQLTGHKCKYNKALLTAWLVSKAKNTFRICNTYCLAIGTMVTQTRLLVTLYVLRLSCSKTAPLSEILDFNSA